jgi:hypothetical protein
MTAERRQAYVAYLLAVREKLAALAHLTHDGASLDAVIEEVDAALGVLRRLCGPAAAAPEFPLP